MTTKDGRTDITFLGLPADFLNPLLRSRVNLLMIKSTIWKEVIHYFYLFRTFKALSEGMHHKMLFCKLEQNKLYLPFMPILGDSSLTE